MSQETISSGAAPVTTKQTNFLAVVSICLGIGGLYPIPLSFLAIVSARKARAEIKRDPVIYRGASLCLVGEALGWAGVTIWFACIVLSYYWAWKTL